MSGSDPVSRPMRPSDSERNRVLDVLRRGAAEGRLSLDTFVSRVDLALRARDHRDFKRLLFDLPGPRVAPWGRLKARLLVALRRPTKAPAECQVTVLTLPRGSQSVFSIGRSLDRDLCLSDATVSRTHALLCRVDDEWFLEDLSSTNGTRINGWLLRSRSVIKPGDQVAFGRVVLDVKSD
jgi:hypothetical protein